VVTAVAVQFGCGEAADEPAREDSRPTEIANCTTTGDRGSLPQPQFCHEMSLDDGGEVCDVIAEFYGKK
jgi:hypothetical protein